MSERLRPRRMTRRANDFSSTAILVAAWACLSASGSRVTVSVREREVNGTVGRSALLASSYSIPDLCSQLTVEWRLQPSTTSLVRLTRSDCSPHPDRPGCNCSDRWTVGPAHTGRVQLYAENGSLLLRDLRRNDSGVYEISVYSGGNNTAKDNVTLTVYNESTETESVTSTYGTPTVSGRNNAMIIAVPTCLVLILIIIGLSIVLTKALRHYCRRSKSDTAEGFVGFNRVSRQELNKARELNSRVSTTYCLLQRPKANSPATPDGQDAGVVYAVSQKAPELNSRVSTTYCLLQLPKANSPATTDGQDAGIVYAVSQKVQCR
ncbi:uncharacterized protein LOC144602877 [Rhinoraja longicauda]